MNTKAETKIIVLSDKLAEFFGNNTNLARIKFFGLFICALCKMILNSQKVLLINRVVQYRQILFNQVIPDSISLLTGFCYPPELFSRNRIPVNNTGRGITRNNAHLVFGITICGCNAEFVNILSARN